MSMRYIIRIFGRHLEVVSEDAKQIFYWHPVDDEPFTPSTAHSFAEWLNHKEEGKRYLAELEEQLAHGRPRGCSCYWGNNGEIVEQPTDSVIGIEP